MQTKHGFKHLSNRVPNLLHRIQRIRLQQKAIAEQTGLDETTVCHTLSGRTDPRNSTLEKIERVVEAEEEKLRAALKKGAAA